HHQRPKAPLPLDTQVDTQVVVRCRGFLDDDRWGMSRRFLLQMSVTFEPPSALFLGPHSAAPYTPRVPPPSRKQVWLSTLPAPSMCVVPSALAVIAVRPVIRAMLAFRGYFSWDVLILVGRAGTQGIFSPGYLFDDHVGHVMPGAFLVAGAITHMAPLNWIGPA